MIDNALETLQDDNGEANGEVSPRRESALYQLKTLKSHQLLQSQKKEILNALKKVLSMPGRPGYSNDCYSHYRFIHEVGQLMTDIVTEW